MNKSITLKLYSKKYQKYFRSNIYLKFNKYILIQEQNNITWIIEDTNKTKFICNFIQLKIYEFITKWFNIGSIIIIEVNNEYNIFYNTIKLKIIEFKDFNFNDIYSVKIENNILVLKHRIGFSKFYYKLNFKLINFKENLEYLYNYILRENQIAVFNMNQTMHYYILNNLSVLKKLNENVLEFIEFKIYIKVIKYQGKIVLFNKSNYNEFKLKYKSNIFKLNERDLKYFFNTESFIIFKFINYNKNFIFNIEKKKFINLKLIRNITINKFLEFKNYIIFDDFKTYYVFNKNSYEYNEIRFNEILTIDFIYFNKYFIFDIDKTILNIYNENFIIFKNIQYQEYIKFDHYFIIYSENSYNIYNRNFTLLIQLDSIIFSNIQENKKDILINDNNKIITIDFKNKINILNFDRILKNKNIDFTKEKNYLKIGNHYLDDLIYDIRANKFLKFDIFGSIKVIINKFSVGSNYITLMIDNKNFIFEKKINSKKFKKFEY